MQEAIGHLSTLVQRIKDEELSLGYARKESLLSVAEFILSWPGRYGRQEYSEAIKTLARYHLAKLANIHHSFRSTCRRLINAELAKPYKGRCARYGKPLTNPLSLQFGHGPICRRKLGTGRTTKADSQRCRTKRQSCSLTQLPADSVASGKGS